MKYIIANWKAHKTLEEAVAWTDTFLSLLSKDTALDNKLTSGELLVIIAPPASFAQSLHERLKGKIGIAVGVQDVSEFDEGPYTGEVTAKNLVGIADYVLVGHSERRKYKGETEESILKKLELCKKYGLSPILCVTKKEQVHEGILFIAYEPDGAIGTGNNTPVSDVLSFRSTLSLPSNAQFLYGGSVNTGDVMGYLGEREISGLLVGGASLDASNFYSLIKKA